MFRIFMLVMVVDMMFIGSVWCMCVIVGLVKVFICVCCMVMLRFCFSVLNGGIVVCICWIVVVFWLVRVEVGSVKVGIDIVLFVRNFGLLIVLLVMDYFFLLWFVDFL